MAAAKKLSQQRFAGLRHEMLTFWQGAAMILGANIGAGILSLPYGSRIGGFPALVVALLILSGIIINGLHDYTSSTICRPIRKRSAAL